MRWVRRWRYELRWEQGRNGVVSRNVDTLDQLRAVVEWARANPHVERCSYRRVDDLQGDRIDRCPAGHELPIVKPGRAHQLRGIMRLVACADCPGHYVTVCPACGAQVYDPPAGPDCGPPR